MDYNTALKQIDIKIEILLNDILTENPYKSLQAETRLTALCLAREYIKDKIKNTEIEVGPLNTLLDVEGFPNETKVEVNNED